MKKSVKIISLVIVMSIVALFFVSCAASEKDIVGTWEGQWTYNGASYGKIIVIKSDGTYTSVMYKNGSFHEYEMGDWEIEGRNIILYDDDSITYHGTSTTYKYKNGNLVNNNHTFKKS